ncbi:TPA: hypothetical protein ACGOWZ_002206, partial [Streptococcus suis]
FIYWLVFAQPLFSLYEKSHLDKSIKGGLMVTLRKRLYNSVWNVKHHWLTVAFPIIGPAPLQ